jgi:formamidopyrimidine-DNA glycosylase
VPELPETETIARDLDRELRGRRIVRVEVTRGDVLRESTAESLRARTEGIAIARGWRRAKLVVLDLATGDRIVVQPRFTGALLIDAGDLDERERRYSTIRFDLDDGRALHYRDIRRLGTVSLMSPARWGDYEGGLGVEPLEERFTAEYLSQLVRGSRQSLKKLLMDQRLVVGVGNIYANEALWRAGLDPSRPGRSLEMPEAVRLRDAVVRVLEESIEARGTSFRDYRDATGARGSFAAQLAAYGRGGSPCQRCGARLVETHAVDGRSTVFCAYCQR